MPKAEHYTLNLPFYALSQPEKGRFLMEFDGLEIFEGVMEDEQSRNSGTIWDRRANQSI
ncbi:hypothetical protein ABMB67_004303 [Halalkalibacter oceani]